MEENITKKLEEKIEMRLHHLPSLDSGSRSYTHEGYPRSFPEEDGGSPLLEQREYVPPHFPERPQYPYGTGYSAPPGFASTPKIIPNYSFEPETLEEETEREEKTLSPAKSLEPETSYPVEEEDSEWGPWKTPKSEGRIFLSVKEQTVTFIEDNGDHTTYDSSRVQVEMGEWRPRYRFRQVMATPAPARNQSAILPARVAYDDFCMWAREHSDVSLARETIHPHNRAFSLNPSSLEKEKFGGHFLSLVGEGAETLPSSKKLEWDEAVAPFSFIPTEESPNKLPESFTKIFSGRKLDSSVAAEQLLLEIPNLPDELLAKDQAARQNLLDIWNSLAALGVVADSDVKEDLSKAVKAISKGMLRPLVVAFNAFREARTALRRKALEKCDKNNPYVLNLIKSSPFSVKLFPEKLVKEIMDSSLSLCRTIQSLLGARYAKRTSSAPYPRNQKRGYSPQNRNYQSLYRSPQYPSYRRREDQAGPSGYRPQIREGGNRGGQQGRSNSGKPPFQERKERGRSRERGGQHRGKGRSRN